MIADVIEATLEIACSSKNGFFALVIILIASIAIIGIVMAQGDFEDKCKKVCPTKYKLMEEKTVCACSLNGQWVLKDLGK